MAARYTGGCACGAVRWATENSAVGQNHCQCLDCQKRSGTGHGSYLGFVRPGVETAGEVSVWRYAGDSGTEKRHAFCPTCGTPLWLTFAAMPDFIAVHAASLDDPGLFQPEMVTYGVRARRWDAMDPALSVFERMPG